MNNTLSQNYPGSLYTLAEEIANAVTHGIGSILAIAGTVVLIVFSAFTHDPWKVVSASLYGSFLILLFLMSTLYHALVPKKAKYVFRIFDHSTIFLLIAGTYTPFTLVTLRGPVGWWLFGIIWGFAVLGVTLNAISLERFKTFSMICYLGMGWAILFALRPLLRALPGPGLLLLVLGGVMYTAGVYFYKKKGTKFMHAIWHLFVLAGAAFHYFCILLCVIRP